MIAPRNMTSPRRLASANPDRIVGLPSKLVWTFLVTAAAMLAAVLARNLLHAGWRAARKEDPPLNPASPSTGWLEALAWTAATGMAAGLARLIARRSTAAAWRRVIGDSPPGM